jgi:hypothetical protein
MNYAEEAAFWYLRLNGFFAITNFVVHKSGGIVHTTDCDVLGVRLPFVFEEVGGRDDDWDDFLRRNLNFERPLGVICQVKSGDYTVGDLFPIPTLRYTIARMGFVPISDVADVAGTLAHRPFVTLTDGTQIAKLLVARHERQGAFLTRGLTEVEEFLRTRITRYPKEKYADRMFFGPVLFQTLIELTEGPSRR